jgi:hypothetical protein
MIAARISPQQFVVLIGTAQVLVQLGVGAGPFAADREDLDLRPCATASVA